jgi:hypothetical protein
MQTKVVLDRRCALDVTDQPLISYSAHKIHLIQH